MNYNWNKDYPNHLEDGKKLFFANGRIANLSVCSTFPGNWLCGKNSFIALKQRETFEKNGVVLIEIEEEILYNKQKLVLYLEEHRNIVGVCFEMPCSYVGEDNPFNVFKSQNKNCKNDIDNANGIFNVLKAKGILSYIDGARILVFYATNFFVLPKADFVLYGLDKSLPEKLYGSYIHIEDEEKVKDIKMNRKKLGGYIRNYNFEIEIINNELEKVHPIIVKNYSLLIQLKDELKEFFEVVPTNCNCLSVFTTEIQALNIRKSLKEKKCKFLNNDRIFVFYFNLSINVKDFFDQILFLKELLIKNV